MTLESWLTLRIQEISYKIEHYQYTTPGQLKQWQAELNLLLDMRRQLLSNLDKEDIG